MEFRLALILLLSVLFSTRLSTAQSAEATGVLVGSISDMAEKAPIKYAFVLVHQHSGSDDQKANIDSMGRFTMRLAPGLYDVFVAADGFAPKCKSVKVVVGGTTAVNMALSPDMEHLEAKVESPNLKYLEVAA